MKYKKLVIFLVFAVITCVLTVGSVSAASNNTTNSTDTTGLADSSYPTYQVNNNHTGQSEYNGPQTNTTQWEYNIGGSSVSVIGSDGTIYTGSILTYDINAIYSNGTVHWKTTLPTYTTSNNHVRGLTIGNNGVLYVTAYESLYALDASNGTILWVYDFPEGYINTNSYPTIGADGTIYFGTTSGTYIFYAINPDRTQKWNYTTTYGIIGSPAIGSDGTVYLTTSGMLYAFDPANGSVKWNITQTSSTGSVIGSNGTLYVTSSSTLYAINPDGTSKWNYTTTGRFLTSPAIAADGTIYIASTDGNFYALTDNGTSATEKWHYSDSNLTKYSSSFTIIIGADGIIYTGNGRGTGPSSKQCGAVYALTPDGQLKWSYELGVPLTNSMIGSDGTLYVVISRTETLWAFQDFVADFAADTSNGLTVQFVDISSNLPTVWIWDFGDESSESYEKNPVHTYSKSGTYKITLTVINGYGYSTTMERLITVNQAPNLDSLSDQTIDTNHQLNFTVVGYDPDGDTITYSASNLPEGATFNPTTGVFSWTATSDQTGTYHVTFTVSDGNATISKTITITVNTAPTLDSIPDKTVDENEKLNFTVVGHDANGDTLTYSASGLPEGASFNSTTGVFSWTPTYDQAGTYHITFTVSDGISSDSKEITITVNNINRAPTLNTPNNKAVGANQELNFSITGNDPDGDTITYSASNLPEGANFNSATGEFTWTPTYAQIGTYHITFTVSDGDLTDSKTMDITVNNVNRAPTLNTPNNKAVNENKELNFTVNGTDPDGDTITYSASNLPEGASFNPTTGVFNWTPTYDQAGTYHLTFTASDGTLTDSKETTITVNDVDVTAPTVTAAPTGGNYTTVQNVILNSDDSTATIYYTTDGSDPTTSSTRITYTESIPINNTTTLKYAAVDSANNWSPVYTQTYNIKSDVYVNITASKTNPQVGNTVTYTFKLGNNGPDVAENVVYTYVIPEGLEFAGANVDQGTWQYNETTRTLTWNLGDVEVGDPYLWLDLNVLTAGTYNIQPNIDISGYNPKSSNIGFLLVNAVSAVQNTDNDSNADGTGNDSSTDGTSIVNAASTTNVVNASNNNIPMQSTGIPLTGLISALLLVGSGLALGKRK
ncbi:putative Ig domain-containing protein [Methanobacterium ferruginis]|uniref:putative Ig domain-containing protein n=1 Tax=Methanobacterium ferruginis TaxID=710191 RepID=UPI00257429BF|nr:putative Ig domain-containing protein [Methanobacterium ferruginis]BDZ66599.1 hypothetical protein GCM10025860_00470 [Methanobacterium ferruginis]